MTCLTDVACGLLTASHTTVMTAFPLPRRSLTGLLKASLVIALIVVTVMTFNQLTAGQDEKRVIELEGHPGEVQNSNMRLVDQPHDEEYVIETDRMDWVDWDFVLQEASR